MPYIKIWIHLIFSTKNREKIIAKKLKLNLLTHIKENSIAKNIYIVCLNCVADHIHILLSLSNDQTISKVAQLIKGESSFWINKNKLINGKFEWQDDYIAVSVSESMVGKVKEYINNQEEHHKKKSYSEEYDEFIKKYGFTIIKD
jgi:REP element-mobilizing transposase RayT